MKGPRDIVTRINKLSHDFAFCIFWTNVRFFHLFYLFRMLILIILLIVFYSITEGMMAMAILLYRARYRQATIVTEIVKYVTIIMLTLNILNIFTDWYQQGHHHNSISHHLLIVLSTPCHKTDRVVDCCWHQ